MRDLGNAALCIPSGLRATHRSRYLLARTVIKRHLALQLTASHPSVEVHTFPSLGSDEFKEYLHISPIHFVMAHDGASTALRSTTDVAEDDEQYAKILLRGIIWFFNTHKLNVALINRIEFRDSKVFTMIVESFTPPRKWKLAMTKQVVYEIKDTKKLLEDSQRTSQSNVATELRRPHVQELMEAFFGEDLLGSYYIAAYAVSEILKHEDFDIFLPSGVHVTQRSAEAAASFATTTFSSNF